MPPCAVTGQAALFFLKNHNFFSIEVWIWKIIISFGEIVLLMKSMFKYEFLYFVLPCHILAESNGKLRVVFLVLVNFIGFKKYRIFSFELNGRATFLASNWFRILSIFDFIQGFSLCLSIFYPIFCKQWKKKWIKQ